MPQNNTFNAKNSNKNVCVIGGGIAGISSAVFLCKNNFKVTLIESSPRFGGRSYSFFDKNINQYIDNGQHILASWYENTFDFLKIIATYEYLKFQKNLRIKFIDKDSTIYDFKCPNLPSPFHLIWGLFNYKALNLKDKISVLKLIKYIRSNRPQYEKLKELTVSDFFTETKQSERIINYFWKPFVVAVFNAKIEDTNAFDFLNILREGFLQKNSSNLVLPKTDLNSLYVNPAIEYLNRHNASILENARVVKLNYDKMKVKSIILGDGSELKFDYFILAVPAYELKNIIGDKFYNDEYSMLNNLEYSPIINIYHVIASNHNSPSPSGRAEVGLDFAGILNSTIQWIFKINENRICLVISSANDLIDKDKDYIIELSKEELINALPEFKNVKFIYSKVIKEKRATFLPDINSIFSRPDNKTRFDNLFIAGDWTDTGYPATIEGAVTSSKNCVDEILKIN